MEMVVGGKKQREREEKERRVGETRRRMGMSGDHPTDTNKMKQVPDHRSNLKHDIRHSSSTSHRVLRKRGARRR